MFPFPLVAGAHDPGGSRNCSWGVERRWNKESGKKIRGHIPAAGFGVRADQGETAVNVT